ncbi:PIN domain-like protein, partial [Mycena filopes]
LQKIFYQLCNFSSAPVTLVFVFDGPGRPSMKRGTTVVHHPLWLIDHLKTMIKAFGYHFYDAPGEAEAELAHLNASGRIDAVITEDSDAFLFGAHFVI